MGRSTASLWLARADEQLYRAPRPRRNRACLEQAPEVEVSADEKSLLFSTSQLDNLDDHEQA